MKVKIIIPIYNDWQSVFKLFEEINNLKIDKNFEISIIVVNDASNHDRSNEEINFDNIQSVKIINMKKNQGHARCIATGLKYILDKEEFDYAIPMDGDGEDRPEEIKNFLDHWSPSTAIFVESEIWPEMISELKRRKITVVLTNARMSERSFKRWSSIRFFGKKILEKFDYIFPQNKETFVYLKRLGVKKLKFLGNLKFIENKLTKKNKLNKYLVKEFKKRKIEIVIKLGDSNKTSKVLTSDLSKDYVSMNADYRS